MIAVTGSDEWAVTLSAKRLAIAPLVDGKRGDEVDVPLPKGWTGDHVKVVVLGDRLAVTAGWDMGDTTEGAVTDYMVSIESILAGKAVWQIAG